jgi:anti-sigma regulatory factor (Ser/Thr protein kinase)
MNRVIYSDGGRISAQVRRRRVLMEVRDSGPGIEDLAKAMTPGFSTAADWVRELGFGAGMGLPNIKKMSDEFAIDSEVGLGTVLTLTFRTTGERDEAV